MLNSSAINAIVLPFMLSVCAWITTGGTVCASQQVQKLGTVSMQGSIIVPACAIATPDLSQSIEMSPTSFGEMIDNGMGRRQKFTLHFVDCDVKSSGDSPSFLTTFDGPAEKNLFALQGVNWGGLQISDDAGNIALPGKSLPPRSLNVGQQSLDYTLRLVWNHAQMTSGAYHAALRFKVEYF